MVEEANVGTGLLRKDAEGEQRATKIELQVLAELDKEKGEQEKTTKKEPESITKKVS